MKWLIDAIVRRWAPGWLLLVSCGGQDRTLCYGAADAWLYDQAQQCEQRGYTWSKCPERPAALDEHMRKQKSCL
jgi:hypothetical protein